MQKFVSAGLAAAGVALAVGGMVQRTTASSHREALAVLNEPCADNTDTFAWVSDRTHDKLYLIMDVNPLHEPGQGNQGLRACNGYRYEFHIARGKSLEDAVVYRVEFTSKLKPEAAPSALVSQRYRVEFTASQRYVELLEEARNLLQHQVPDRDVARVHELAMSAFVEQLRKRRQAATTPIRRPSSLKESAPAGSVLSCRRR